MNKEKYIYTTTHFMDESFDTARIIDEKKLKISKQNIVQIYLRIYQISFFSIKQSLELVFTKKANKKILKKNSKFNKKRLKLLEVVKFKYFNFN